MNINIFKRLAKLEEDMEVLQNVIRGHMIKHDQDSNKSKKNEAEKIAKRRAYAREYYARNKAKRQA